MSAKNGFFVTMEGLMECISYASSESYDIRALAARLSQHYTCKVIGEVLHVKLVEEDGDVFYFPYGTSITWNLPHAIFQKVQQYSGVAEQTTPSPQIRDIFSFSFGEKSTIYADEIVLEGKNFAAKLAASYAISQSIKLEVFEQKVDISIENTRSLPETLAKKGKISLSRRAISKKIGALFLERSSINLHTDILDLPDYFWDNTEVEPFYLSMRRYLNLESRIDLLNKRLSILHELLGMLGTELNHHHSSRLEWTIIYLILIEVVIVLFKDVFGLF